MIDRVKIKFKAGNGGNGGVAFGRNRKPSGGDGGKGGDVYLVGSAHSRDLGYFQGKEEFAAQSGDHGGRERSQGKDGADLEIKVPLTTCVYNEDGDLVAKIETEGQRIKVATGGRGGLGNFYFRAGQLATLRKTTPGREGGLLEATLELNLKADVVFIGLPNAGKSSLLNFLTQARAKVGNYPFTTLTPHLGVEAGYDGLVLMDLPGLIEGTSQGKGLGPSFLKHTHYAKLVAHVISLESSDLAANYSIIRNELAELSPELSQKPEAIIFTKSDVITPEELAAKEDQLKTFGKPYIVTTVYDLDLMEKVWEFLHSLAPIK